ncbi:deoxyribose-phosphate aldolase [Aureitalea sp. L0-47]|uniref:DUF6503 family protein n=1 Tax=Aureitalea sp. L0-47 TaxID=2816962 RepID=UPI0022384231|nr:DUF6503 family protein [Aureitalea sp. L0-47]MCW5518268.1 deoxyribose-phosphate aldolase [Aureitalea sp. L0-47]
MRGFIPLISGLLFLMILTACISDEKINADTLLEKAMGSHGSENIYGKEINFDFRDWSYVLDRDSASYTYTRIKDSIEDKLHSKRGFSRSVNGEKVKLADSMVTKYSNSLNSVLYFFQLPLVLEDAAVQKEYLGTLSIKEQKYHTLKVTFRQEGGGVDFEDEFRYWINAETYEIDYLAYSYLTDGGGVRFREAFRKERLEDILFQDYRNFKPKEKDIPLDSLPDLFVQGNLQLLSTIENMNISVETGK